MNEQWPSWSIDHLSKTEFQTFWCRALFLYVGLLFVCVVCYVCACMFSVCVFQIVPHLSFKDFLKIFLSGEKSILFVQTVHVLISNAYDLHWVTANIFSDRNYNLFFNLQRYVGTFCAAQRLARAVLFSLR